MGGKELAKYHYLQILLGLMYCPVKIEKNISNGHQLLNLKVFFLLFIIISSGCAPRAKWVLFRVDSIPQGAQVEVDGVSLGKTPTSINLQMSEIWVGLANGGWRAAANEIYQVTCLPPPGTNLKLFSQSKQIKPSTTPDGGNLFFDLQLDSVRPRDRVDIEFK